MKKSLASLIAISMMVTVLPVAMAVEDEYPSFEYNGETHYMPDPDILFGLRVIAGGYEEAYPGYGCGYPFFLRTNPLLSGSSEQYLYGYGYGYFAGGIYGYGYGFGYGYDYGSQNVPEWFLTGHAEKFGLGMGESYGEFKIPVSNGVTMALPVAMTFESEDLGGAVYLPEGLVMESNDSNWDGTLVVTADDDAGGIRGFGDDVVTVNVDLGDTCDDCTVLLSGVAVVVIPQEMETDYIVRLETASGEYDVEECIDDAEYDIEGDMDDPNSYYLNSNEHCYTEHGDYVYVATRHFSEFGAGGEEEEEEEIDNQESQTYGYYRKIAREKTVFKEESSYIPQTILDFEDLVEVRTDSWQYLAIQQMLDLGLFKGSVNADNRQVFQMNDPMTRGMAATVICRYMGCDENAMVSAPFEDVSVHAYYGPAVSALKEQGVVEGKNPTTFDPTGLVTRAQFLKMIVQAYMALHPSVTEEWTGLMMSGMAVFDDVKESNWYYGYMVLGQQTGIITGYTEGAKTYAKGEKNVSRVEAASMLSKVLAF